MQGRDVQGRNMQLLQQEDMQQLHEELDARSKGH
jgi:hypothetical protein